MASEKILTIDLDEYFKEKENFKRLRPRRRYYSGIGETPFRTGWLQALSEDIVVRVDLHGLLSILEHEDCSWRHIRGLTNLLLKHTDLTSNQVDVVVDTYLGKRTSFFEDRSPLDKEVSNRISKAIFDKHFDFLLKQIPEIPKKTTQRFFHELAGEEQKIKIFQIVEDTQLKTEFLKKLPKKYATDQLTSNLVDLRQEAKGIITGKKVNFEKKLKTALGETFAELFPEGSRKENSFAGVTLPQSRIFNKHKVDEIFFRKHRGGVSQKKDPNRFYLVVKINSKYRQRPYRLPSTYKSPGFYMEKTGELIKHERKMGYGVDIILSFPKTSWDIFNTWVKENLKSSILDCIIQPRSWF